MIQFTEDEVRRWLPMSAAIDSLRSAFMAYGLREAQNHPRRRLILPTGSVLHSMSAAYGGYFGTKIYSTHPKHGAHFIFLLYDAATARPLAQFEANHLGQIRTGAASGLATDLLAPEKPLNLALIGSGFQARTQLEAIEAVRKVASVRVWSRNQAAREHFAQETGAAAVESAADACAGADVVITATSSKEPVIPPDAVGPETLILAMGSNVASRREIPGEIVNTARIVVDDLEQCKIEAGDLLLAKIDWSRVESLSQVAIKNTTAGETRRLILFKSVGIALEDVAVASYIYEKATPGRSFADLNPAKR